MWASYSYKISDIRSVLQHNFIKFMDFGLQKGRVGIYEFYIKILKGNESMAESNEKRENFVRLAEGRTQAALEAIRKLGNLSNRRAYEYEEADLKKIIRALRDAISEIERKFGSSSGDDAETFKL